MDAAHHQLTCCLPVLALLVAFHAAAGGASALDLHQNRAPTNFDAPGAQFQRSANPGEPPGPSVAVRCHADSVEVTVQADLFHTGLPVDAAHLRLGADDSVVPGAECRAVPSGEGHLTIRAPLMACGTKLSWSEATIIYSNTLIYSPEPSSDGVLRLDRAAIPVECHYETRYAVGGVFLSPTWAPMASSLVAEDEIDFNLRLMTGDWEFQRGSHVYYVGDPIHFEVSVSTRKHTPMRVYVDHCVATVTPDIKSTLRYDFIERHGCLADMDRTKARSRFLPRVEGHKLRFQLVAFRFFQEPSNQIYITCYVKAVPSMLTVSSKNRACSRIDSRWRSADGSDEPCRSCDATQSFEDAPPTTEGPRTTATPRKDNVKNAAEHKPVNYIRVRSQMVPRPPGKSQLAVGPVRREAGDKAEKTIQLGPVVVIPSSRDDAAVTPSAKSTATSD